MSIVKHLQEHDKLESDPWKKVHRAGLPYGSWMSDTFSGDNIYAMGFDMKPTVFYDPEATSSFGQGKFWQPFKNTTELNAWITGRAGLMAGQVLGVKRGSVSPQWAFPAIGAYGTSGDPFFIVPYGDAEAMPVFTGGVTFTETGVPTTGWAAAPASPLIYRLAMNANLGGTVECEIFDERQPILSQRFVKQDATGITTDAATCSALLAAGMGTRLYVTVSAVVYLYIYPFEAAPDFTKIEVMYSVNGAIYINYSDVATSGYITLAGLDLRGGGGASLYSHTLSFLPSGASTITSVPGLEVIGCRVGQSGFNSILLYGASDAVFASNAKIVGNYLYDCSHNTVELASVSSADVYGNTSKLFGSNAYELWAQCSSVLVHDNLAIGNLPGITGAATGGLNCIAHSTIAGGATDSATSANNKYYRNVFIGMSWLGLYHTGAGGLCYDNTITWDTGAVNITGGVRAVDDATSHTTTLALKNCTLVGTLTTGNNNLIKDYAGVAVITPTTNNLWANGGTWFASYNGTVYSSLANYNTASNGGDATKNSLQINPVFAADGYTPGVNTLYNVGTAILPYSSRDWAGRPMLANGTDTKPAIGAVARP